MSEHEATSPPGGAGSPGVRDGVGGGGGGVPAE